MFQSFAAEFHQHSSLTYPLTGFKCLVETECVELALLSLREIVAGEGI